MFYFGIMFMIIFTAYAFSCQLIFGKILYRYVCALVHSGMIADSRGRIAACIVYVICAYVHVCVCVRMSTHWQRFVGQTFLFAGQERV